MTAPDPQPRVARPQPADDRGWLGLVLDALTVPAAVMDAGTGQVVVKNAAAAGRLGPDPVPLPVLQAARGPQGALVPVSGPGPRVRAFARVLPPADGKAPYELLTLLDADGPEAAEEELRQALEVRDEFFSVATHELKDPLFAIQLSLQLLRRTAERQGPVPVHVAHHLDVCGRQADRLSRLIDNLLDVARIQGGRLQLDLEVLDLADLAREVVGRFEDSARASGTGLRVEAPGQVIGYFDRLKLDQVLSNLLTNALKYGAGHPVAVRVREEADRAVLEVADHGPGVAPADRERIFARFERASAGHRKESLGLGLYIVRSLVEAHGGTVTVRGDVGEGATFTVTLPRNRLHHKEGGAAGPGGTV